MNVLTNTTSNYAVHIRITYHKGCLITFNVPSHKLHPWPGEVARKQIYILSIMRNTYENQYTIVFIDASH